MPDFSMWGYRTQYVDACTLHSRLKARVADLEAGMPYIAEEDQQEALARLDTARAELKAAGEEVDRLYYLSTFGRSREEMAQKNTVRPVGLQPKPHYPAAPTGMRLER